MSACCTQRAIQTWRKRVLAARRAVAEPGGEGPGHHDGDDDVGEGDAHAPAPASGVARVQRQPPIGWPGIRAGGQGLALRYARSLLSDAPGAVLPRPQALCWSAGE